MGEGFSGDLSQLGELEDNLRELAEVPSRMATAAAEGISDAIERQFDAGTDPYGEPWADLAQSTLDRGRRPPPLTDTGALRAGIEVSPMRGAGIQITIDDGEVAGYHQTGTSRMPARRILPEAEMPPEWEEVLRQAGEEAFERTITVKKRG